MKKIFKKAMTVLGTAALIGMTVGVASAASYPTPFTSNTAIVVGANAAPSDTIAASSIASNLDAAAVGTTVATLTGASGVSDNEIALGGNISMTKNDQASRIPNKLTDNKISSLIDKKINWDDGTGSKDYRVHEEILVGDTSIKTTLDDNDYTDFAAMTQNKALEYKYVFNDAFPVSHIGMDNGTGTADDLYLTILGKQYQIKKMTDTSITVVTSKKVALGVGDSTTVDGKTFTVSDIFSNSVQVNGEIISSGSKDKVDGLQVEVTTIGYNSNDPSSSKVILNIGKDISKTYNNGDGYIDQDENNPLWVWDLSALGTAGGYIGVQYNQKQIRAKDNVVYAGGSYMLPDSFGEAKFDGLTNVTYKNIEVSFDAATDLWNSTDKTSTAQSQDSHVLIIKASDLSKDAITLKDGTTETNKIYLRWAIATDGNQLNTTNGSLEVFYSDVNDIVDTAIRPRYFTQFNSTTTVGNVSTQDIGTFVNGDTTVSMNTSVTNGQLAVTFTDDNAKEPVTVYVGGTNLTSTAGDLKWFGGDAESTDKENAQSGDLTVQGKLVGTKDNDIMTYDGVIVRTPKANLDNDDVVISVPNDRVYADVSVLAGGSVASTTEAGVRTVMDNEVSSVAGKNLIVIGGSAINSVAASLLGSAYRGAAFTSATGVASGQFLIQSFDRSGKTALLVAGYNSADTDKAVTYLLNNNVDTTVGTKLKGTSATEATVVTA